MSISDCADELIDKFYYQLSGESSEEAKSREKTNLEFKMLKQEFQGQDEFNLGIKTRKETNQAAQLFSKYVVENKDEFIEDEYKYKQMLRAYLNIMMYSEGWKRKIRPILNSFVELSSMNKERILRLSEWGRYASIPRLSASFSSDYEYRKNLLNLIQDFRSSTYTYNKLMENLVKFVYDLHRGGRVGLSVIISALQDKDFMVYNTRSALPLTGTTYDHLVNGTMLQYKVFNEIYKNIRDKTGWSLLELDIIVDDRYIDGIDS